MWQETVIPLVLSPREKAMRRQALFMVPIIFAAGWIIAGCAARQLTGSPINEEGISKIVVGKTTRAEILSWFGPPYRVEPNGGEEALTYLYAKESNWTILVYWETRSSADILTVYLDRNGVVSNYAFSEGVAIPEGHFPVRPVAVGH